MSAKIYDPVFPNDKLPAPWMSAMESGAKRRCVQRGPCRPRFSTA